MAPTQEMAQATGGGPSLGDRGGCGGGLGQGAGAGSCKSEGLNGSVTGGDVVEWLSSSSMQGPGQVPLPLQLGLSSWQLWRVAWADPLVQQLAGFDRLPGPLSSPAQPAAADDACQAGRPGQGQGQGQGHTARVQKQHKGQGNGVQQPHEGGEQRPGLRDRSWPQAVPRSVAAALSRRQQAGGAGAASDLQLLAQLAAQPRVEAAVTATLAALAQAVKVRCQSIDLVSRPCQGPPLAASAPGAKLPLPGLLILFSGGVDSSLLAALAHACLPLEQPIELCNICFNAGRSPDRQAAHSALQELVRLGPQRPWRLIEVEASLEEVDQHRQHLLQLLHPADTLMSLNIGAALWLAARAQGRLYLPSPPQPGHQEGLTGNGCDPQALQSGQAYTSPARVVLLGHGADEQCGGYGRHRTRFATAGWPGLAEELALDMRRMWLRNLGRDDRLVADWGREARHPFLDEELVRVLQASSLPDIVDLSHPPGVGDKLVLRAALLRLGLPQAAIRVKRAIQFGSEIGKLSNVREFGSNRAANKQSAGYVSISQLGGIPLPNDIKAAL
ncbi:asparagine synthase-domain-containing protein [Haematococcus lacustris]